MSSKQTKKQQTKTIGERLAQEDIVFGQGSFNLSEREVRKENAHKAVNERHQSRES
ncbi:hypothetical protein [Euhalothece natronophila]|uniref:hypothetical protein n=1 Tax=Euhalothece natronophila TaxID=577489 RepID=UPI001647C8F4|nr:hypothetical protein [Euhalothece natronophila]